MTGRRTDANSAQALYEAAFARAVGAEDAVSFHKGRVALYAILKALGTGPGDYVIFPGFTCVMVPFAAVYLGARPLYVDIDPDTYNMAPDRLKGLLAGMDAPGIRRTKAIVAQHTFGIPADMEAIGFLARRYGIPVVEDCAHTLGSRLGGRTVGTMGEAAFFSSQWSKPYSTGLGGMAVTRDAALADRLRDIQEGFEGPGALERSVLGLQVTLHRKLFTPGLYWTAMYALRALSRAGLFVGSSAPDEFSGFMPEGYEKRMGVNQAKEGLSRLSSLNGDIRHRKALTGFYSSWLAAEGCSPDAAPGAQPVMLRYPVRVSDKEGLLKKARASGIELGSWFESVLHPAKTRLDRAFYVKGSCPEGEEAARRVVNLPTHPRVTEKDAKKALTLVAKHIEPSVRLRRAA